MLSVIIKDSGEPKVIQLTYENLWKELKDIEGSELVVSEDWFEPLAAVRNTYVCFVEADCLVNSGYFSSQLGFLERNRKFRKLSMMSSSVAVTYWVNRFFGYSLDNGYTDALVPNREKKSRGLYPIQVGYLPGSIVRTSMIRTIQDTLETHPEWQDNLVDLSARLSFEFWQQGDGNPVYINPNTTYVTTENYVNDIARVSVNAGDLPKMFKRESI